MFSLAPRKSHSLLIVAALLLFIAVFTFVVGSNPAVPANFARAIRYVDLNLPLDRMAQLRVSPAGVEDLRYDADGDGDFESMVVPTASLTGEAALDMEAPTITFNEQSARTSVTIELTASDNNSGVRIVRYSFDGLTFEEYSVPLQIDPYQVRTVFAFADDNAGNRSPIATYDVPQPPSITAPADLTIETAATN